MQLFPYTFCPRLKSVIWGGGRIAAYKGLPDDGEPVGESWELSGLDGAESVVAEGPERGLSLTELVARHGTDLLGVRGAARAKEGFPLLVKLIDACRDLSVQVHPDEAMARRLHGCGGKAEMWYVVAAEPGAAIYAGLAHDMTLGELDRLTASGDVVGAMRRYEAHAGDAFYLPAGCMHMLGAGCMVVEVQQPCDVTYRIYDHGRLGADGRPRQLHLELAREALDLRARDVAVSYDREAVGRVPLVECPWFTVERVVLHGSLPCPVAQGAFSTLTLVQGQASWRPAVGDGPRQTLREGWTMLMPASAPAGVLEGEGTLLMAAP